MTIKTSIPINDAPAEDAVTKVVCVTGGAKRIGAAIVRHMHALGYAVVIHCNTSIADAQKLADELNGVRQGSAAIVQANLLDIAHFPALKNDILSCFGRLDALVHNASRFYPTVFDIGKTKSKGTERVANAESLRAWDELMISNAKAPYFLTQALLAALQQSCGVVISLLDIHANDRPFVGYSMYNMAKAAHRMLVKSLSLELAPSVRVNGVAPGANIWPDAGSDQSIAHGTMQNISQHIPLARIGRPDDIAAAVAYLAQASYVTGHVLSVDGGRSLTMAGG